MSLTQSMSSPTHTPRSRPTSLGSGLGRSKSLRLTRQPPIDVPVPPSLADSPYLTSPHSIFRRALSDGHIPSQEDEEWLRDTIPLSWEGRDGQVGVTRSLFSGMVVVYRIVAEDESSLRGRSSEKCREEYVLKGSMSSPPLVRARLPDCEASTRPPIRPQHSRNLTYPRPHPSTALSQLQR